MTAEIPITLGDWLDLREELRAAEVLLEEMQFAPTDLTTFWAMSAELLALLQEVDERLEAWRQHGPAADEREAYQERRRRTVALLARSEEIGLELQDQDD